MKKPAAKATPASRTDATKATAAKPAVPAAKKASSATATVAVMILWRRTQFACPASAPVRDPVPSGGLGADATVGG